MNRPRRSFSPAILCWILTSMMAWAGGNAGDFLVDVWNADDGVPGNSVTGFAQGTDGYLWMVSDLALARFDGERFVDAQAEQFAPSPAEWEGPLHYARRLFKTRSGAVWLTTSEGDLWRWRGHEFEPWFPPRPSSHGLVRVWELGRNDVLALAHSGKLLRGGRNNPKEIADAGAEDRLMPETARLDAAGRVWFLTERGEVVRMGLDGSVVRPCKNGDAMPRPLTLTADAARTLWLGTENGLFVWRQGRFAPIPPPVTGQAFPVRAIQADLNQDRLWISSGEKAWIWREGRWTGPVGDWPDSVPWQARVVDHAGQLWLAPPTRGLWCLQPDGTTVQLGPEQGLSADATALFCDREGDVWASIYRLGIARIRKRRFNQVNVLDGRHATPLWNIAQDAEGSIWFSADFKGPVRWQPGTEAEPTRFSQGMNVAGWTKALTVDHSGRVAAALTGVGVVRLDHGVFEPALPWPDGAGFSRVLFQDHAGRWWLGTDLGLHSWSDGHWRKWGAESGLPVQPVRAITEDVQGRLWVGTFGGGLARLETNRWTCFTRQNGLVHNSIYTLYSGADGSLWVGTQGGLGRWRAGQFTSYTSQHGLPDNRVVQILEDGRGFLWLGTRDGLCRVSLASIDRVDRGEKRALDCLAFDRDDGLPTRVFQDRGSPACWRARDGRLWFLTASGAVYCRPGDLEIDTVRPPVRIEKLVLDGQPCPQPLDAGNPPGPRAQALSALALRSPARLELSPGAHLLEIHYTAPSLAVPERVQFQYQMVGLERDWVNAGSRRVALYNLLPPGQYRFRVRACNHDGVWNEIGAELALVVQPYLWQRPWFPALVGAVLACLTSGTVAWFQHLSLQRHLAKLELQRAKEAERTRISRDLHDHLGGSLTEISMLAADGSDPATPLEPPSGQFRLIKEKVDSIVTELDALVWVVDPQQDTLRSLASYLASFVEEYPGHGRFELPDRTAAHVARLAFEFGSPPSSLLDREGSGPQRRPPCPSHGNRLPDRTGGRAPPDHRPG